MGRMPRPEVEMLLYFIIGFCLGTLYLAYNVEHIVRNAARDPQPVYHKILTTAIILSTATIAWPLALIILLLEGYDG